MHRIKLVIATLLLLLIWGCTPNEEAPEFTSGITEDIPEVVTSEFTQKILNDYRPENATALPDFSGEITDIRIQAVPREYVAQTTGIEAFDRLFEDLTSLQIYYGYFSDGQWHDIPSENFDLKGIFDPFQTKFGFDAAGESHIVKIGPYLLVCVCYQPEDGVLNASCRISDTLGNKAQQEFAEYETPRERAEGVHGFGYFKEDRDSVATGDTVQYTATHEFGKYYYLILDYSAIQEGYELECIFTEGFSTYKYTLTYQDIVSLIEDP